jgi:tRNA (adenine22-N1)-methyltransferase
MSINLTPRLLAVASLVRGGSIIADIGTDHGYLPIYLIETGKVPAAIAADIGRMPLENARKSVEECGLSDKIELRLSDGLQNFKATDVREIVFAGMGGTLIAEKLSEILWVKDESLHFVFQPQSRAEDLREFLFSNGYSIGEEIATHEGRRSYITFDAVYTGQTKKFTPAECFIGKLPHNEDAHNHLRKQSARLQKKHDALKAAGEDVSVLSEIITAIQEFIND